MYGAGTSPSTEEMLMIRPVPAARMCGRTAFVIRTSPKKLMSKTRWSWATELSSAAPAAPVPALLTRTSSRPNRSITRRTTALTDSSLVTSRSRNVTPSRWATPDAFRLVPTTSKPASTSASDAAFPIPEDAPVTSATGLAVFIATPFLILDYDHNIMAASGSQEFFRSGGAHGSVRESAQAGDEAADHRGRRRSAQARRHSRLRDCHPHGRRGADQRRFLRPLRVQGGPRRKGGRRTATRAARAAQRPAPWPIDSLPTRSSSRASGTPSLYWAPTIRA